MSYKQAISFSCWQLYDPLVWIVLQNPPDIILWTSLAAAVSQILQSLEVSMLSKKFEGERVDLNAIMSASHEGLIRLGVRTTGDRERLRNVCRWVYTRSSTSISLGDTHKTSSNKLGRYFFHNLRAALDLVKDGLKVKEGEVQLIITVLVTLIEKERLILHGLGNSCVCQTVMPRKYQHQRKNKCYRQQFWGLKKYLTKLNLTKWQDITNWQDLLSQMKQQVIPNLRTVGVSNYCNAYLVAKS